MAVIEIPTTTTLPYFTERITLEGTQYELQFRYNYRHTTWYLDIFDADGILLAGGRPVRVDSALLRSHKYIEELPQGLALVPFDTTLRRLDPQESDFGDRVVLLYFDSTETLDG